MECRHEPHPSAAFECGTITLFGKTKMHSAPTLFLIGCTIMLAGCAPKTEGASAPKSASANKSSTHFVFSASLDIEDLTVEDYAALNADMSELLRRAGLVGGKGYLIPTQELHGGTHPTLNIEGDQDSGVNPESVETLKAFVGRFTLECRKALGHTKTKQAPNQPPQTTTGSSAPGRV